MLLSHADQQTIERVVARASGVRRNALRAEARTALTHLSKTLAQRILFLEETKAAETAIELLVRIEAIEKDKGWWFRFKRRVQLTQIYLGSPAPTPRPVTQMPTEAGGDAVKLMKLIELAANKYLFMPQDALMMALAADFPSACYGFDLDAVTFVFPAMPEFYFTLSENEGAKSICVTGRGQYTGFTLFVPGRGYWHCSALHEPTVTPARALARAIERKFGIRDVSRSFEPEWADHPGEMMEAARAS